MKYLALVFSLIALIGVIVIFQKVDALGGSLISNSAPSAGAGEEEHEEEIEVAIVMGRIQRFHQKFWLAMRANNPELSQFYLHEMEEAMEEIAEANVIDDGVDISAHMRTYGLDVNEFLQKKLREEGIDGLRAEAELLVKSCNSCHLASKYEMIQIKVPDPANNFPDQEMLP